MCVYVFGEIHLTYLCLTFGPAPVAPEEDFFVKLDPAEAKLSEVSVCGS